jgi:hypothetical protein
VSLRRSGGNRGEESKTNLDLVEDEKSTDLVATLAKSAEEVLRRLENTTLTLQRIDSEYIEKKKRKRKEERKGKRGHT